MAQGFKMGGGGGSKPLNFAIVGGTTEPSNLKDNTIWVNTDKEITSWIFSATEPSEPSEGMVWIATSNSSTSTLNILKKNGVVLNLAGAKQYTDGAWVEVESKLYQDGDWATGTLYLYNKGDECTDVTGGWEATKYTRQTPYSGYVQQKPTVTIGETNVKLHMGGMWWSGSQNDHYSGTYFPVDPVDITGYKTLKINVTEFIGGTGERDLAYIGVTPEKKDAYEKLAEVSFKAADLVPLDVSQITGQVFVYIAIDIPNNAVDLTYDSIYLE